MAYSDFTIKQVQKDFNLELIEKSGIFSEIKPVKVSDYFIITLEENIPLAVSINTEKARSELLIANVLIEIRKQFDRKISFFSGVEFTVDKTKNLNGFCDFIISLSAEQLFVKSPVITIVEAKNENIMGGLGQCIAEMIAAQIFNEQEGHPLPIIYGTITTGIFWKFIKLQGNQVFIDLRDYSIEDNSGRILAILAAMVEQQA